jgi:hypothetical protein
MDGTRNRGGNGGTRHRRADLATARKLSAQKGGLQPHRFRYWLNEVPDAQRGEKIRDGCEVYAHAPERAKGGERTISSNREEMVGDLKRQVLAHAWTALHGQSSCGKTQLVVLLVEAMKQPCLWLRLHHDCSHEENRRRLDAVEQEQRMLALCEQGMRLARESQQPLAWATLCEQEIPSLVLNENMRAVLDHVLDIGAIGTAGMKQRTRKRWRVI